MKTKDIMCARAADKAEEIDKTKKTGMDIKENVLHLIRHGKTEANEKRLYCGQTDLPLSEAGRLEIVGFANKGIYPVSVRQFFTSGLIRTEETLDIIYGSVSREAVADLAEYRFGQYEMFSYEELKDREDYQAWIMDTTDTVACPGGESKQQFKARVISGFLNIAAACTTADEFILVVCHGGVITCIMDYLWPNIKNFYEWQPQPGRGYSLYFSYASGSKDDCRLPYGYGLI